MAAAGQIKLIKCALDIDAQIPPSSMAAELQRVDGWIFED